MAICDYLYNLPKCGHPRRWSQKQCRSPRDYWFQLTLANGDILTQRKTLTWAGACNYGDAWFSATKGSEILFCIDGRVPESQLAFPPIAAIWNRWELEMFVEDGKPCVKVLVGRGGSRELT